MTEEMRRLFLALLRKRDWVTGEQLAGELGWSRKKLQQCMKTLSDEMAGRCRLEVQKHKGYRLTEMSREWREELLEEFSCRSVYTSMEERRSLLALDLLFREDYVSMERLAEEYYLSKTVIFEEIRNLKRWLGRMKHLELEVSSQKGIRIHGSEKEKRYFCAVCAQMELLRRIPAAAPAAARYEETIREAQPRLKDWVSKNGRKLSGEDFALTLRYLGISRMRSALGLCLDEDAWDLERQMEMFWAETKIQKDSKALAEGLERCLERYLGEENLGLADSELLMDGLGSIEGRISGGRHAANYYDKEILSRYPLAIHLIRKALRESCGWEVSRSDLLNLAAYVGGRLETRKYPSSARILLAGNQNFLILGHIREYILSELPWKPQIVELRPCYGVEEDELEEYDLLFTTEPEMLLRNRNFLLLPAAVTDENRHTLEDTVRKGAAAFQDRMLERLKAEMEIFQLERGESLEQLLPEVGSEQVTAYTLGKNTLLLIDTEQGAGMEVREVLVKEGFFWDYKRISKVMAVRCGEDEPWAEEYFRLFSCLLQEKGKGRREAERSEKDA